MKKRLVMLLAGLLTVLSMGFGLAQFSDVPAGHWAKEAVEALAAKGLVIGFPDGTFRGNENLTRYQAALIIYRLLQQIEEELKAQGTSPTMEAMDPKDLEALKNAVQELAAELAALGVRVSALEDSAATKEDIARLEAMIQELKAQPAPEPGMDQAALKDLAERVEAASIAADTALAQAQQLAEQLDALAQDVEGVKGDVAALSTQVESNAQAIQALNELAVLLNQDVLSLQDRVTALEKGLADLQGVDFKQFATKEDVAAVQEFAAALRSDLVGLSEKVSKLEGQVAELNKVRYSIKGSLSATYGYTFSTSNFDLDRLFPGNTFSDGDVTTPESNRGNFSAASATLTFGAKVAEPGQSGLNVSEASVTVGANAFTGPFNVTLKSASLKGNVDGQAFSVSYSNNAAYKFNDYLFNNTSGSGNPGVVATFSATKFPLNPEFTFVTEQSRFGVRAALKPFSGLGLALNYAGDTGTRTNFGVDASLEVGPVKVTGLFDSSKLATDPPAEWFDNGNPNTKWAYYAKGEASLGPVNLSANYHAVDPAYIGAGFSVDSGPYKKDTRGLGVSAKVGFGPVTAQGYAESEVNYNGTPGNYETSLGAALTLGSFRGFSLTGFYNAFYDGGNSYFDLTNQANAGGTYNNSYSYTNENQKYSSSFGVRLAHDGAAQDALIPTLNLTAQYANFYVSGYTDIQVYANLAKPFKLAFLSLSPGFRYHIFTDPAGSSASGNYTTLKAGAQVSTDPLLFGLSLDGGVSYRNTNYTTLGVTTYELYYRAGVKISDFLAPKVNVSAAYAHYEGDQLAGAGLPTVGSGNQAFNFTRDRVYRSPDPIGGPWAATPGTQSGLVEGFYLQADYYNLSVAYGEFVLDNLTRTNPSYGRGFKISYKVEF
ncbi:S-layer homology domain-containing protein [Thermus scotoductus]|uniref:S-layer protein n=1 Tax=Thermus scotoductus TaxID=37636 RepID=A0A430RV61_THESC|nr:S-layer homology domain-containing protein [Thermus scotoductus]RTG93100.1 S-layer protein [Thermus scotoductus]RTH23785.1 S-layer protein [Thermus scotoductus]